MSPTTTRVRPRLSRTMAPARWTEYRALLEEARCRCYRMVSLEHWLDEAPPIAVPTLVLRHDVDQHPRSALQMAAVEAELGLSSTWYFRWRTAHPAVISTLREQGFGVGLHYETLSRHVLAHGLGPADLTDDIIERCRMTLAEEVAMFAERHGPITSVCPHGDSRAGFVSNAVLMRGLDVRELGIRWDGNEAMRGRGLRYWLTDRSAPEGRWKDGVDPTVLLAEGTTPMLCLTHPNNWASGRSLWADRLLSYALRTSPLKRVAGSSPVRTGSDHPPRPYA